MLLKKLRMQFNLSTKFNLLTLSMVLVTSSILVGFFITQEGYDRRRDFLEDRRTLAVLVSRQCEYGLSTERRETLLNVFESLTAETGISYAAVFNNKNEPLFSRRFDLSERRIPNPLFKDLTLTRPILHEELTDEREGKRYLNISAAVIGPVQSTITGLSPVQGNEARKTILGYVQLSFTRPSLQEGPRHRLFTALIFTLAMMVIAAAVTARMTKRITSPIKTLVSATHLVSNGKLNHQIPVQARDELSDLVRSFNSMFERLQAYRRQVDEQTEDLTAVNQQLLQEVSERKRAEELLQKAHDESEVRVQERTRDLLDANKALQSEIAERKKAVQERASIEEQFRQSQKMEAIGRLAGGIAHDFNNVLTVIKGYGQLLLMEAQENSDLRENMLEILKSTDRAADLTRQLLAFSRRQVLEIKVVDLNSLLTNLEKMLRRIIGEDVQLTLKMGENLRGVRTDHGQMEQALINLAVNARDAMISGGKLTIETENVLLDEEYARSHVGINPGQYVRVAVSDTGTGMEAEVKERIFEPFFTTKEKGKGTGLGLSMVYGIVNQSGGHIWVYSEPGCGATFKLYFPSVNTPQKEGHVHDLDLGLPSGSETILLVEDEERVRKLAVRVLQEQGYHVLEAANGKEALSLCQQQGETFHLMVTDVVMPGMGGRELAEQLTPKHPQMKVLYMSGYTDNAVVQHGILNPGIAFLQKPFSPSGLAQKVRQVLDRKEN